MAIDRSDLEPWMRLAIDQARLAFAGGEVPIGAVLVRGSEVLAAAHNERERLTDPTAHAELVAIRRAAEKLGGWRLTGTTLFVTMEPCLMCAGALVQARIERLVYGAREPKFGAVGSLVDLLQDPRLNHRVEVIGGVLEEPCRAIMQEFFQQHRIARRDG